jgi:S1-C subfamily serine protease
VHPSHVIKEQVRALIQGSKKNDIQVVLEPVRRVHFAEMYAAYDPELAAVGREVENLVRDGLISGMFVHWSQDGGPAERAGIAHLDVVKSVDGTPVPTFAGYCRILESKAPGDSVTIRGTRLDPGRDDFAEPFEARVRLPR